MAGSGYILARSGTFLELLWLFLSGNAFMRRASISPRIMNITVQHALCDIDAYYYYTYPEIISNPSNKCRTFVAAGIDVMYRKWRHPEVHMAVLISVMVWG